MAGKLIVGTIETQNINFDSDTSGMTIDSIGRIKNPNVPYIFADPYNGSSAAYDTLATDTAINFRNVISSRGGITLDASNFRFTLPVTGIYQCSCAILCNISESMHFNLYNHTVGANQASWYDVTTRSCRFNQAMPFTAGDVIDFRNTTGNNLGIHRNTNATDRYTMASIYLIG